MFHRETSKSKLGKAGENLACDYLIKNGYNVLTRNYKRKWGEIDVVAKYKDGTLVFVEVKTMADRPGGLTPEDQLTAAKMDKFKLACEMFVSKNPGFINDKKGWRMDLLAISVGPETDIDSLTQDDKNVVVRHYKNIASR